MIWILDRQRYWAFFKAYLICFGSLVGLYVVIDAFSNVDEFTKVEDKFGGVLRVMGRYYLLRIPAFYDRLCGVITMMAAIFTVTWMQKNNELIAMMAAGLSAQRVIRPVIISAALVSGVAVLNQELVIPRISEELQQTPDDDGKRGLRIFSRRDVNEIVVNGTYAFRAEQAVEPFNAVFPPWRYGTLLRLDSKEARYIPEQATRSPLRGGWLIRGATASPSEVPADGDVLVRVGTEPLGGLVTAGADGVANAALLAALPPPRNEAKALGSGETFFLRTNLTFTTMTRSKQWFQFASTPDLIRSLKDTSSEGEWPEISVFIHSRNVRPLLSVTLLCLSLPFVLGGDNKNMFVNLGRALATSAVFYLSLFVAGYLGNNDVLTPAMAAWAPLFAFATLAAARWDSIRT